LDSSKSKRRTTQLMIRVGRSELFSDYGCEIHYHLGKVNLVADALSRKEQLKPRRARAMSMTIHSSIKAKILEAQSKASKDINTPTEMLKGLDEQLKKRRWYSIHPGYDKMYYDLRGLYWWPRMKKDIAIDPWELQDRKKALGTKLDLSTAYHPEIDGQSERTIQTLEDMLRACVIVFGGRLKTARDRQKSYAYNRRKPLEFSVGDKVLLKASPWKGVVRYGKRSIHNIFHVSNQKKCLADENLHVPLKEINIDDKLCFVKERIEILDCEVKKLKQSWIPVVKVRWNSRLGPEFTWE
nr:putative reverse transcriptase domain-containing protein [Tanacetum cinerariifolium]